MELAKETKNEEIIKIIETAPQEIEPETKSNIQPQSFRSNDQLDLEPNIQNDHNIQNNLIKPKLDLMDQNTTDKTEFSAFEFKFNQNTKTKLESESENLDTIKPQSEEMTVIQLGTNTNTKPKFDEMMFFEQENNHHTNLFDISTFQKWD